MPERPQPARPNAGRVLIVDDDDLTLDLLRHMLEEGGYAVDAAHNGREALDILRAGGHRLVISDWEMPVMTGIELCHAIRCEDLPGYVYFILLTSRDQPDEVVEGLAAGADDFIKKPFYPAELAVRLRAGERVLALETREVAIFALAKLAESRDSETGAHLERVRTYCRVIGRCLAAQPAYRDVVNDDFVRLLYETSPLHDIGKVGIPDAILLKPGRLDDREFEVMKTHTTLGAETLAAAIERFPGTRFLQMAYDIAATHHEEYDGTGYPAGLSGNAIPLCGRIVALVDVYDALTSRRVYKTAYTHDVARSLILGESGRHFDPELTRAFLQTESEFIEVRRRFPESGSQAA